MSTKKAGGIEENDFRNSWTDAFFGQHLIIKYLLVRSINYYLINQSSGCCVT